MLIGPVDILHRGHRTRLFLPLKRAAGGWMTPERRNKRSRFLWSSRSSRLFRKKNPQEGQEKSNSIINILCTVTPRKVRGRVLRLRSL